MATAAHDEIADWYEEWFPSAQQPHDPLGITAALRDLLGAGSGVCLEIGCGTGVHAAAVRELGWTPVGVDLSSGMLRHALGRLPIARARRRPAARPGRQRPDPAAVVLRPGYLDGHWTKESWTDQGIRDKVGASHWPLPELLHAFLDAGLTLERFTEGGTPLPIMLAVLAREHG